jgi:DNA-binding MarR family transcriptional regulator/GNAT superfamily N-acetyltransferase
MDPDQIARVRRFNRAVSPRIGALEQSYLRRGRPLGEARLIFEVGTAGADVRDLRARLGLDSGYFSRLLRSLETQGLVTVRQRPDDARRRRVGLTRKGRTEYAAYDRLSDALAASVLESLDMARRDRLVAAMAEVEHLLRAEVIDVRLEPPDSDDARWCLDEYFHELAQRFDSGFDPARSNPASTEDMTPPAGSFVVARIGDRAVGCGALKRTAGTIGEIKRMWTSPAARGLGVAREILRTLETIAHDIGIDTLRLETNRALTEARKLYKREGYREVAPFNDEPYAHHWFEKELRVGPDRIVTPHPAADLPKRSTGASSPP